MDTTALNEVAAATANDVAALPETRSHSYSSVNLTASSSSSSSSAATITSSSSLSAPLSSLSMSTSPRGLLIRSPSYEDLEMEESSAASISSSAAFAGELFGATPFASLPSSPIAQRSGWSHAAPMTPLGIGDGGGSFGVATDERKAWTTIKKRLQSSSGNLSGMVQNDSSSLSATSPKSSTEYRFALAINPKLEGRITHGRI